MKGRLLIGLVLGVLLTVAAHQAARMLCIFTDTHNHYIPVDNSGQIPGDEDSAYLSLGKGHKVFWQAGSTKVLQIRFEIAKFPTGKQPFQYMTKTPDGKYMVITNCKNNQCDSGDINGDLKGDLKLFTCLKFPYDQQVGDQTKDGWIIIDK